MRISAYRFGHAWRVPRLACKPCCQESAPCRRHGLQAVRGIRQSEQPNIHNNAALRVAAALVCLAAWALAAPGPAAHGREGPPDSNAIEEALGQLNSPDWILQARGMAVLGRAKAKQAAAPLKAILAGQGHPWIRGRALVALAGILGEGAADEALAMAGHAAPELRAAALEALAITGSPRALAAVEAHLADPAAAVRGQALAALARLQKDKAWARVAPLASGADPVAACQAARAMVYVDTPDARQELQRLLGHKEADVRLAAAQALREVRDPQAISALVERMASDPAEDVKSACEQALAAYQPETLARPMLAILDSKDRKPHAAALKILKARPSAEARAGIAAILGAAPPREADFPVTAALELLAGADPRPYQAVFVRYLEHPQSQVRLKTIEVLAQCPGGDLFDLLKPCLADAEAAVRAAAIRAIRRTTQGAPPGGIVDYLGQVVQDPSAAIFEPALVLLKERLTTAETPKALAALEPVLGGTDERRRYLAVDVLEPFATEDLARRIAAAQGYITEWKVLGPYPNPEGKGLAEVYPPETDCGKADSYEARPIEEAAQKGTPIAAPARLTWQPAKSARLRGHVDLREAVATENFRVAYAIADLEAPQERKVCLTVVSDDGMKAWLNGALLGERRSEGTTKVAGVLKKGRNRLLLKTANEHDRWSLSVRLSDADGRRIDGITAGAP